MRARIELSLKWHALITQDLPLLTHGFGIYPAGMQPAAASHLLKTILPGKTVFGKRNLGIFLEYISVRGFCLFGNFTACRNACAQASCGLPLQGEPLARHASVCMPSEESHIPASYNSECLDLRNDEDATSDGIRNRAVSLPRHSPLYKLGPREYSSEWDELRNRRMLIYWCPVFFNVCAAFHVHERSLPRWRDSGS